MSITSCKVCQNTNGNELYTVREMQLGFHENFEYQLCHACGCMQLQNIPADLARYYPNEDYYSFTSKLKTRSKPDSLRTLRSAYLLHGRHRIAGSVLAAGYTVPEYMEWVKVPGVQFDDAILDVGTGNGNLLVNLHKNGFTNLTGIDPFMDKDLHHGPIPVYKKDIYSLQGSFDYIMLHHVFEHMDQPLKVLQRLKELLRPGKFLLIRTPVMGHYGWKTYGVDWVGLDAPRHLLIHTVKSMELLAKKAGFEMQKVDYDSTAYHIWASEQYQRNIPLMASNSYMVNKEASVFTRTEIEGFKQIAARSNSEGEGDQASFYLFNPG